MAIKFCRPTATGLNDGSTWENGYTSLQAAHTACGAGDDVWMTEGVYSHTALLNFNNSNNPDLVGGFSAALTGTAGSVAGRTVGARTTLDGANTYAGIEIAGWAGTINGVKFLDMYLNGSGAAIQSTDSDVGPVFLRFCDFDGCDALGNGGAIALVRCGDLYLTDTTIKNCTAVSVGGAVRAFDTLVQFFRCRLENNHSNNDGGVISMDNNSGLFQNCVVVGNSARYGGAVVVETGAAWLSTSTTYVNNTATIAGGGGAVYNKATHNSHNCIYWGNRANGAVNQLNSGTVTYSVVEGGYSGTGIKTGDPVFVGTGDDPYALTSPTSSAIDAANSSASGYPATDILGAARYDDPAVTSTGVGTIDYADIGAYEYTPPPNPPGLRKFLYGGPDGYPREQDPTDDIALGGLELSGDIDMNTNKITELGAATVSGDVLSYGQSGAELSGLSIVTSALNMNSQQITNLADGTLDHHAVNLSQLEQAVITGGTLKELLVYSRQLNNAQGILAASVIYMSAQPVAGDTITLTNGTSTRTFGATSGGDVQYTIGATVADTMQNLSDAIETDGTAWVSDFNTELDSINADGVIVTIPFDNTAGTSKIYGTWATQANIQIVDYAGEIEYSKKTSINLPSASPAASNFGFRRLQAALIPGEMHYIENNDRIYGWDDDADQWNQMSGGGSIPDATAASGGGTKGKITVDSDYGLTVTTGILSMVLAANRGLGFSSTELEVKENTAAGIEITASGIGIDLAASTPALSFDGSGDLQVDVDTTAGLEKTSGGIAIDLAATTPGLGFDSGDLQVITVATGGVEKVAGGLQIKIDDTPDTLDVDADGLKVVGLPTLFKVDGTASSANVTAANLSELVGGGVTTLHTHEGASEAKRIENAFTAGEDVAIGDPVYFDTTNSQVAKADASSDTAYEVLGVAKAAISLGNPVEVVTSGPVDVLTGATAGDRYYLDDGGGLTTTVPAGQMWVVVVGHAVDADTLFVLPRVLHKQFA